MSTYFDSTIVIKYDDICKIRILCVRGYHGMRIASNHLPKKRRGT